MRSGAILALGVVVGAGGAPAQAEPSLEASGFVGIGFQPTNTQLGDAWAREQVPGNAALFGLRLTLLAFPALADIGDGRRFQLAFELETDMAASRTRSAAMVTSRPSYFAPVFNWRGHLQFRYADRAVPVQPNLVVGGGGATVAAESPYMRKETDPVVYYGGGVNIPLTETWLVRIDARHVISAAYGGGITSGAEIQIGFGGSFGAPTRRIAARPAKPLPQQPIVDETDRDGDGLPDHLDRCPEEKETVNGLDDGDGCAELDADADGVVGDADKCATLAEDVDAFEDDDGCPDPDNDADGIADAADKCPIEAETRNGFADEDGCPDGIPAEVVSLLSTASAAVKFAGTGARLTEPSKKSLDRVLAVLQAKRALRLEITARPATSLAKRRAEAVKWYFIEQGAAEGRFVTKVAAPGTGPALELTLTLD